MPHQPLPRHLGARPVLVMHRFSLTLRLASVHRPSRTVRYASVHRHGAEKQIYTLPSHSYSDLFHC
jgi:hypothetical protein